MPKLSEVFKLPVPWKEFVKHPVVATLYICLIVIGSLYIRSERKRDSIESDYKERIDKCETRNYLQDIKIERLTEKMMKSDSIANRLASKFETLKELGKIQ